jgi:hypothetical protein
MNIFTWLWRHFGEAYCDWRAQPVIGGRDSRRGIWRGR